MTRTCMLGENFSLMKNTHYNGTSREVHIQLLPCSYSSTYVALFCSHLVPQDGWTALMYASQKGHTDAARTLVSTGARVDLQDEVRRSICVLQTP